MKYNIHTLISGLCLLPVALFANTLPTVSFLQTTMRPETTLMDIDYAVTDPDDASVEVVICAFKDGVPSLADFISVTALVEGTEGNVGPNVPTGVTKRVTWDVAQNWDVNNGNVKVCIMPNDGHGFINMDWIVLPADKPFPGDPEMTISARPISNGAAMQVLWWHLIKGKCYRDGDTLKRFDGLVLATGGNVTIAGRAFAYEKCGFGFLRPEDHRRIKASRAGFPSVFSDCVKMGIRGPKWVGNQFDVDGFEIIDIIKKGDVGHYYVDQITNTRYQLNCQLLLRSDGNLTIKGNWSKVLWQMNPEGRWQEVTENNPINTTISAGDFICLSDGFVALGVLSFGFNGNGYSRRDSLPYANSLPLPTTGTAIAGSGLHVMTLNAGRVSAGGDNSMGQCNVPATLAGVKAIASGGYYGMAVVEGGQVVGWGLGNPLRKRYVPEGLGPVIDITVRNGSCHAMKKNGSIVQWNPYEENPQASPSNLTRETFFDDGGLSNMPS